MADFETAPSAIKQVFQAEGSALQRIFAKVQQLKVLNDILMECLEPKLRRRCLVANIYIDKLVVLAENSSIATQFRFCIPDLLTKLQAKHPLMETIKTIECKVGA
jgi:hypothetical protein